MQHPQITLFNTQSRQVEEFSPKTPDEVSVYCCGPTVYSYQHIGNLRTYIFEDVLIRMFRRAGYRVQHVMNITDVGHLVSDADEGEDKMLVAAKREGKTSLEIAEYYTQIFFQDCKKLNIQRPDTVCKATEHIQDMIALIQRLEQRGFTYTAGGNVYFDISKLPDYGKLAKLDLAALQAGARIEVDKHKRSPLDFALWFTKSKFENQELQWDSPWGRGYPGWHIECSAMSMRYLGENFDIHCGGIDHIPVHHTNEIAQSEGAIGKPWVKYWMHGEFLLLNADKMSKSKGGTLTVSTIEEHKLPAMSYRFFCLNAHYRSQLNFSWDNLTNAARAYEKLVDGVRALGDPSSVTTPNSWSANAIEYRKAFDAAVFNDLGTAKAMASVWGVLNDSSLAAAEKLALLIDFDDVLGFGLREVKPVEVTIPDEVSALLEQRARARQEKDWSESDRLRDAIASLGFTVEDKGNEQKLKAR
jgi:cysteinyl-tRNA synthetase